MGAYDGQKTSTDVGHPPIPKYPPGYPSSGAGKAADSGPEPSSPTKGERRTEIPTGT